MSIRQGFLALLTEQPMGGYQLRQEFEARTGGTWPLNIGQAYTTLARLQRDGLVEPVPDDGDTVGPHDDGGSRTSGDEPKGGPAAERYRLTDPGRAEATAWWLRPVARNAPARDELAIKLALAVTVAGVDVGAVVQRQRTETLRALRDYTRLKKDAPGDGPGLAWSLVLDSLVFAAEAEVRWLDHVETAVLRATGSPQAAEPAAAPQANGATKATAGQPPTLTTKAGL